MRLINTIILLLLLSASLALAETVDVKYRGPLDLAPFACTDVARSSFIRRVCFDKAKATRSQSQRDLLSLLQHPNEHRGCVDGRIPWAGSSTDK
jgi:hypothetical protein